MKRTASAVWKGTLKEGNGLMYAKNSVLNNAQYSFRSRFENGEGTNPEELIAAAHAGCFSMALSAELGKAGYAPESVETSATITLEEATITASHLVVKVKVPGAGKEEIEKAANEAKVNCPVSKVLNLKISMELTLL
ncbi:MAG: OsmC family protein [Bacteroidales bacterium]|nr:OsmC family protein [Bacteroidales bacterium]